MKHFKYILGATALLLASCSSTDSVRQALLDDPDILYQAMQKDPGKFMMTLEKVSRDGRQAMAQHAQAQEEERIAEQLKNPVSVNIEGQRAVEGNKTAPILVVAFSDFQCPFCKRGFQTVQDLRKKYGKDMAFVMKHLPLDFHPLAMPAAKRFEAIAIQSPEKAYHFHDEVFTNQERLTKEGEKFLDAMVTKVGANLAQVKKDMNSEAVTTRIQGDMAEAKKFGIEGTPTFIVAGVILRGAQPVTAFQDIISKRQVANTATN